MYSIGTSELIKLPLFWNDDIIDDVMARFLKLKNDICFSLYLNEY